MKVKGTRFPKKLIQEIVRSLGLAPEKWSRSALKAYYRLGELLVTDLTCKILMVRSFEELDAVHNAMKTARVISENDNFGMAERLAALNSTALLARSHKELAGQIMAFADKVAEKGKVEKPRNLPPTVPMQFNFNGPVPALEIMSGKSSNSAKTDSTEREAILAEPDK